MEPCEDMYGRVLVDGVTVRRPTRQRKTMAERNIMTVSESNAKRIKALVAEYPDGGSWADYANDILDVYLTQHRSGKPLALPEERFSDRDGGAEWETVCL